MVRVVLIVALVAALYVLGRSVRDLNPETRKRVRNWTASLAMVLVLVLVFARFGFHWLAVAGAAGAALVRAVLPWLWRLLPFARQWRKAPGPGAPGGAQRPPPAGAPRRGVMSRQEALEVLGLGPGATREEISQAYKDLMKKVHPDKPGGSNYLASKLNEAKQTLLS